MTHIQIGRPLRYAYCYQQTLGAATRVSGLGYWSGRTATLEIRPAPVDSGITFVRCDQPVPIRIPAHIDFQIETPLRTRLGRASIAVEMVEHVLAALHGLKIDNCDIWVDAEEIPGFDGSSQVFVDAILQGGIQPQAAGRYLTINQLIRVESGDAWIEARPPSGNGLKVQYHLDYGPGPIGEQFLELKVSPESFCRELACARTFILEREAKYLQDNGLGTHCTYKDLLVFDKEGPIQNTLRFDDECVRHKALDLVGDLALCGQRIMGDVCASRSGHKLTAKLVKGLIKAAGTGQKLRNTA